MGRVKPLLFVTFLIAFLSIISLTECQTTRFKKSHRSIGVNGEKILHFHHGLPFQFPFTFWIPGVPGGLWAFPFGWLGGIRGLSGFMGNRRGFQGGRGGFLGGFGGFPGGHGGFPGGFGGFPGGRGGFLGGFGGFPGGHGGFPGGFGGFPGGLGGFLGGLGGFPPGGFVVREKGYAGKTKVKREDELRRNLSP